MAEISRRIQNVCEAVADLIGARSFEADVSPNVVRSYTSLKRIQDIDGADCIIVPSHASRHRESNGSYRRDVVVDTIVRVRLGEGVTDDIHLTDQAVSLVEEIDNFLAADDQAELLLPDGALAVYVEPGDREASSDILDGLGIHFNWDALQEKRMVEAVVRVAYTIDEDY